MKLIRAVYRDLQKVPMVSRHAQDVQSAKSMPGPQCAAISLERGPSINLADCTNDIKKCAESAYGIRHNWYFGACLDTIAIYCTCPNIMGTFCACLKYYRDLLRIFRYRRDLLRMSRYHEYLLRMSKYHGYIVRMPKIP